MPTTAPATNHIKLMAEIDHFISFSPLWKLIDIIALEFGPPAQKVVK